MWRGVDHLNWAIFEYGQYANPILTLFMTKITLRPVTPADRAALLSVEERTMPHWLYLPQVFDLFLSHRRGEFTLAEINGEIVACAKFTVLPDNTAWLETIRVVPERQGLGIGKAFYKNYDDIAAREGVDTMRMYTGGSNVVSKGLAEFSGLQLAEAFDGLNLPTPSDPVAPSSRFESVTDPAKVTALIMPHAAEWGDWLVMNRTFYRLTPALCAYLAARGMVYTDGASAVVLGARFMPEQGYHLGFFAGDAIACLDFAVNLAQRRAAPQISCLFPSRISSTRELLRGHQFQGDARFIVMGKMQI